MDHANPRACRARSRERHVHTASAEARGADGQRRAGPGTHQHDTASAPRRNTARTCSPSATHTRENGNEHPSRSAGGMRRVDPALRGGRDQREQPVHLRRLGHVCVEARRERAPAVLGETITGQARSGKCATRWNAPARRDRSRRVRAARYRSPQRRAAFARSRRNRSGRRLPCGRCALPARGFSAS